MQIDEETILDSPTPNLLLTINGSKLAVGTRPGLAELEAALRGVALSDSPVIVKAPAEDQPHLLQRLHELGRRKGLPIHECRESDQINLLLQGVNSGADTTTDCLGTWALYGVESWDEDMQERLGKVLEALDLGRLHGRLRHEKIPRVVLMTQNGRSRRLVPLLSRRISYFTLTAEPQPTE